MTRIKDLPKLHGDGIQDDAEAIRAWVNAGRQPPFENNRTYLISESIVIPANITIICHKMTNRPDHKMIGFWQKLVFLLKALFKNPWRVT